MARRCNAINDPVNFIDRNGKFALHVIGAVVNGGINAAVAYSQGASATEIVNQGLVGAVTGLINPAGAVVRAAVRNSGGQGVRVFESLNALS